MSQSTAKVLVIGFDGLDYELYKKFNDYHLSVIPLYSPIPVTGPAWTSIYTGDSVDHHGVRDGWGRERTSYRSNNRILDEVLWLGRRALGWLHIKEPPHIPQQFTYRTTRSHYLWDLLGERGYRVKLFDIPITFPPRPLNGVHVAGFPLRRGYPYAYPETIDKMLPHDYFERCDIIQWAHEPYRDGMGVWKAGIRRRGFDQVLHKAEVDALELVRVFQTLGSADFQMIQFSFADRLGHVFGINRETETAIYQLVNRLIQALKDNTEYDDLFLISDHGFQNDDHTNVGVLAYEGKDLIANAQPISVVTVKDFAPTVLRLFGIEHLCDGKPIYEILKGESFVGEDRTSTPSVTIEEEQENKEIRRRLEALGYF